MKIIAFILPALIVIFFSCTKEKTFDIPPEQQIIGNWKIFQTGFLPDLDDYDDDTYWTFKTDSSLDYYFIDSKQAYSYNEKYWIRDTLLFITYPFQNNINLYYTYRYYLDKDLLRLDYSDTILPFTRTTIFRRLE